jgi:GT2 family glycosyltransferase
MAIIEAPDHWRVTPDRPPVVVAIPHWNHLALLRDCIEHLFRGSSYPHYRICVFDQGSTDGSVDYLRRLMPEIDCVFCDTNIGFVEAMNAVIERYARWDVVLLNNDTRPLPGWLDALVETAGRSPAIGLVGAKLVSVDGRLLEAGCDVYADATVKPRGRFESSSDPRYQEHLETDFCSGACLYVKRTVLDRCGPLERCYSPGYYEDVDLAFKARAAGFRVLYEPRATVVHHEQASFGHARAEELIAANRTEFRARWGSTLAVYPANPWAVIADGRSRLLVVSEIVPGNTLWARARRIRQLVRDLSSNHQVVYLNVASEAVEQHRSFFEDHGVTAFYPGCAKAFGNRHVDLDALLRFNFFPTIVCGNPDTACFVTARFGAVLSATSLAVDLGMEADVVLAARRSTVRHFVVSTADQQCQIAAAFPAAPCALFPCAAEVTGTGFPRHAREDVVFLSDNLDGVQVAGTIADFVNAVVPVLRRDVPHFRLRLAGSPVGPELLAADHEGLTILPAATPIRPILDRARAVVIPQHWCGPETISNIEEARARSIPLVTSRAVMSQAGLHDDVDALAADTPREFVRRIVRAVQDPWCWNRLATASRRRRVAGGQPALATALDAWSSSARVAETS